ncbi:acyl carrier protein [Pseudobutyrivibrio xylanivorans]|uniref:Acyl carrier protein n=1 Tax=Pseudobutyrivibrio xylanivorans TaxID=185007 RepID=A0A5P6VUZ8_PSEXY|nr:acyl carrier protein [Pseudobutyrivibrio xylanivorans]QFJ56088.1 acyl carrier protein [Pseudobutyrivibrio xylanivorans]
MTDEIKLELLADLFECEVEDLSAEMSVDEIENWDSMTKLSLIVLMDDECGKTLTSDGIKAFKTVRDIMDFMG